MGIDQALHNTPKAWQEQQDLINKIAQAAARGESYGESDEKPAQAVGSVQYVPDNSSSHLYYPYNNESSLSSLILKIDNSKKVKIATKDLSWSLVVADVCITEAYVALALPQNVEIQDMRMKAKLTLGIEETDYPVMYIGGNFEFKIANLPPLRILSFARLSGNISK